MKKKRLTVPELALIAGTRGMLGAGIGLLLAGKLSNEQRRGAGWALVVVGAVTTVPLLVSVFGAKDELPEMEFAPSTEDRTGQTWKGERREAR